MKFKNIFLIFGLSLYLMGCEKDFLEVPPQDSLTDETFWTNEGNIETFAYGFYPAYFSGYGSGYTWGKFFTGESLNDDFAATNPPTFTRQVPTSGGGWTFSWVRKANIFIDRVENSPIEDDARDHWVGVGRFFRGLEYSDLTNRFGDVPWYEEELTEDQAEEMYKPRDSRTFVMDKVLEDFRYAAENVRVDAGVDGLTVNRDVVLGFMSRVFLFEGTWQKYHEGNDQKAAEYLEAAKWAANEIIESGRYSLGDYRDVFSSVSLAGNPEVILYREYESGVLTHSLMSYNNRGEAQTGVSKDAIDSYLTSNGLPIEQDPAYQGDQGIENVMANRDPRLHETVVPYELRINGVDANYSTTGFATHKFLNEDIKDATEGFSNLNITDAPVLRYGEVLVNYAEAAAELATVGGPALTQEDLNRSINVLRDRPGIGMPHLEVAGDQAAVNGTVIQDPDRDPQVSGIIWEIRRERRTELMMEGFRNDDLRRWKQLDELDMLDNPEINMGAWIDKSDYEEELENLVLVDENGNVTTGQGYIKPATAESAIRLFTDERVYLRPIPLDQITLYRDYGVELRQNPGWE